jgi:hypothetical protein
MHETLMPALIACVTSAGLVSGPVDGLAVGVDLVVVLAVGEGGGFLPESPAAFTACAMPSVI